MDLGHLALQVSWALAQSAEVGTRHVDAVAVPVHRDLSRKAEVSNDPSHSHVYRARAHHQTLFRYVEISKESYNLKILSHMHQSQD